MRGIRKLLCGLIALAMALSCGLALAEELQFVPGEDLVLLDQDGVRIILKGDQPVYAEEEVYTIGLTVENNRQQSIAVSISSETAVNGLPLLAEDETQSPFASLLMNSNSDCEIGIWPMNVAWKNDASPEKYEQIRTFAGVETLSFGFIVVDSGYDQIFDAPTVTVRF